MNEDLSVGQWFFRSVDEFENAPANCRQTADGCALEAYLCPSEQWTIGDGCCFWEDGTPVKQGDILEDGPGLEERRRSLLMYNARYCEDYVREHVRVPLTQFQFDALCDFRFNTRETTLRNSTRLLPAINAQEWQKAAVAFTEFVYGATTYDGKPYQRALRGLLRRRLWNGLVFLGYDPSEAVKDDDVALPCDRKLLSSGIYRDIIRSEGVTTLNQVRMKATPLVLESPEPAQAIQPLPAPMEPAGAKASPAASPDSAKPTSELVLTKDMQAAREASPVAAGGAPQDPSPAAASPATTPRVPARVSPEGDGPKPADPVKSSATGPSPVPSAAGKPAPVEPLPKAPLPTIPGPMPPMPPVGTKPISPNTKMPEHVPYRIDPTAGLKPMEETERFVGAALMLFGTFARVILAQGTAVTGVGGIIVVGILDMMKSPTNLAILVTVITMGITAVLWVVAFIVDKLGLRIKKRGERTSTQAMY